MCEVQVCFVLFTEVQRGWYLLDDRQFLDFPTKLALQVLARTLEPLFAHHLKRHSISIVPPIAAGEPCQTSCPACE